MRKKFLVMVLGLTMTGLLLAGCGGNNAAPAAKPEEKKEEAAKEEPAKEEEAEEAEEEVEEEVEEAVDEAEEEVEEEVEEVAEEETSDSGLSPEAEAVLDELMANITVGYSGVDDEGSKLLWGLNDDASAGLLLVVSADETDATTMSGPIIDNGDGSITITDEASGLGLTLVTEAAEDPDGEACLHMYAADGSIECLLYPCPAEDVVTTFGTLALIGMGE